jgi:hypothetical protein
MRYVRRNGYHYFRLNLGLLLLSRGEIKDLSSGQINVGLLI